DPLAAIYADQADRLVAGFYSGGERVLAIRLQFRGWESEQVVGFPHRGPNDAAFLRGGDIAREGTRGFCPDDRSMGIRLGPAQINHGQAVGGVAAAAWATSRI